MKQLPYIGFIACTPYTVRYLCPPKLDDPVLMARLATGSSVAGFKIFVSLTSDTTPLLEYDDTSEYIYY